MGLRGLSLGGGVGVGLGEGVGEGVGVRAMSVPFSCSLRFTCCERRVNPLRCGHMEMAANGLKRLFRSKAGKVGLLLLVLNEIRGIAVVGAILWAM